jgi:hypothetical protein
MASIGMLALVHPRGGFGLESAWASTLRLTPGDATSTIHNPFRRTYTLADTSRSSSMKDSLIDLRPLGGTFGNLAALLGKLDLGPVLLAQLESVEPSGDAREAAAGAVVLRWVLLPELPQSFMIGSANLYSRIGLGNFEARQRDALRVAFDSRSAILGSLRRLHTFAATNVRLLDFVYGLLWLLPFFTQFCVSGASAFDGFATTAFTWVRPFTLKPSDAWLVGWFLSLPAQARELLSNTIFAQSLDGDCKRVIEVVLRKIARVDRSFDQTLLTAIQSNFRQPQADVAGAPAGVAVAAGLPDDLLSDFVSASGRFIAACEQTTPVCAVQAQRVTFHGTPEVSSRLRMGLASPGSNFWVSDQLCSNLLGGTEGIQHFAGGAFLVALREPAVEVAATSAASGITSATSSGVSAEADPIESASQEGTSGIMILGTRSIPVTLRVTEPGVTPAVLEFFGSGADFMEEDL